VTSRNIAVGLAGVVCAASLATSPRPAANATAPLLATAQIDSRTFALIRNSCADCHSDATRYPWYSYVAPVSWLIQKDVRGGRARMNFSLWSEYSNIRRERFLSEIANQVKDRDMPLPIYTVVHRDAKLSDADVDAIFKWTQAERLRLIEESAGASR
jgi:hypothetical protein